MKVLGLRILKVRGGGQETTIQCLKMTKLTGS